MYGPGNYVPPPRVIYWSMRGMAYLGSLVVLVALLGSFLLWRGRLERTRWFCWFAVVGAFFPFGASLFGWVLTEVGRQPWIVQGLLKTAQANSPAVSTTWVVISLTCFVALYAVLIVLDIFLMRRYAGRDPQPSRGTEPEPAPDAPPVIA
jgi:cytochrome d ubiquinol oxidase subunit I